MDIRGRRRSRHRVVHGGPNLRTHQRLTPQVLQHLKAAIHFAPLHIPPALDLIEQASKIFGDAEPMVCFDNAFHRLMPPVAAHLPLPQRYFDAGVIRCKTVFTEGLSYESLVYRLGPTPTCRKRGRCLRIWATARACAPCATVLQSIDTSMGLTSTGGVPMGTRSGDLDPGVLLYLMRSESLDADGLEKLLNGESGLAGLAEGESDMQALAKRIAHGDADAELAVDVFSTAVRKYVGAYAALMGGLDLLVFTGGIGEHSEDVRRRVCEGLAFLGISADEHDGSSGKCRVMKAEEELQMARHCRRLLAGA